MRRILTYTMVMAGATLFATPASAQIGGMGFGIGNVAADPFSGYYSWFLPRQAAMAASSTVNNQLSQFQSERVDSITDSSRRNASLLSYASMGIGGAQAQGIDDDRPRNPRPRLSATGPMINNHGGRGIPGYYDRAGSYYPTMRGSTYRNPGLPANRRR